MLRKIEIYAKIVYFLQPLYKAAYVYYQQYLLLMYTEYKIKFFMYGIWCLKEIKNAKRWEQIVNVNSSNITREVWKRVCTHGQKKIYRSCRILSAITTDTKVFNSFFKHINHNHWWLDLQHFWKVSLLTNLFVHNWPPLYGYL